MDDQGSGQVEGSLHREGNGRQDTCPTKTMLTGDVGLSGHLNTDREAHGLPDWSLTPAHLLPLPINGNSEGQCRATSM